MAGKLEILHRAYSKIENNDIKLNWVRIEDISKILDIEPADLISFDDSLVFNNCSQSGKFQVFNNNLPDELKKSCEDQIDHLEKGVLFLRGLLAKSQFYFLYGFILYICTYKSKFLCYEH